MDAFQQFESMYYAISVNEKRGNKIVAAIIYVTTLGVASQEKVRITLGFDHNEKVRADFMNRMEQIANDDRTINIEGHVWFSRDHWLESYQGEYGIQWQTCYAPAYPETGHEFPYGVMSEQQVAINETEPDNDY